MNISYRNVKKEQTYCCSKNDVKNFFQSDSDLHFYFDELRYWHHHNTMQGTWLCHCSIQKNCYPKYEFLVSYWNAPSINFYALDKKQYPDSMRQKFLKESFPKIQEWCEIHYNFHPNAIPGYQILDINLNKNKIIYTERFKRY